MENVELTSKDDALKYDFKGCVTAKDYNGVYIERDVAMAAIAYDGVYTRMATALQRSRNGLYNFCMANARVKGLIDDIRASLLDKIEEAEFDNALNGDRSSRQFILKAHGKDRGYADRVENTGANGGPIMNANFESSTDDPVKAAENYRKFMNGDFESG